MAGRNRSTTPEDSVLIRIFEDEMGTSTAEIKRKYKLESAQTTLNYHRRRLGYGVNKRPIRSPYGGKVATMSREEFREAMMNTIQGPTFRSKTRGKLNLGTKR